jgi:hypothetical protein
MTVGGKTELPQGGIPSGASQAQPHITRWRSNTEQVLTLADGNQEDKGSHGLEDTEPLATLGTLSSDIEELVFEVSDLEVGFTEDCQQKDEWP